MDQEKRQNIALMKYSAIAPLISGLPEEFVSLEDFYRHAAAKGVVHPDGNTRYYAPATIESWYRKYMSDGFDGLLPTGRADLGQPRKLTDDIKEQIEYLKTNYPRMSATSIYRQLRDTGSIKYGEVSLSTVTRYINALAQQHKTSVNKDMRRYERPHINEVWCGDTTVGPYLRTPDGKKRKVYIMALIDDASRFIVGIDVFFKDNFINLMSVLKSAVSKFGRPQMLSFDNGGAYKNKQMELLAARIGTVLNFNAPYTPVQKAKIERFFLTLKNQWLACLDIRDFSSLDELRGSLLSYVSTYNQTKHSSLNGKSPQERFFSESQLIKRLSEDQIDKSFLLEVERRVSIDNVLSIDNVDYEVDCRFAKQRIRVRYSPDMKELYVVEADDTLTPIRLLNKVENSFVKREKIQLCRGDE